MLYRVLFTALLAAAAGSALAQDLGPIGAGFAGPVWPATQPQYSAPVAAGPVEVHFETDYVGPRLLDDVSSRAEHAIEARLERELDREAPLSKPAARSLVTAN